MNKGAKQHDDIDIITAAIFIICQLKEHKPLMGNNWVEKERYLVSVMGKQLEAVKNKMAEGMEQGVKEEEVGEVGEEGEGQGEEEKVGEEEKKSKWKNVRENISDIIKIMKNKLSSTGNGNWDEIKGGVKNNKTGEKIYWDYKKEIFIDGKEYTFVPSFISNEDGNGDEFKRLWIYDKLNKEYLDFNNDGYNQIKENIRTNINQNIMEDAEGLETKYEEFEGAAWIREFLKKEMHEQEKVEEEKVKKKKGWETVRRKLPAYIESMKKELTKEDGEEWEDIKDGDNVIGVRNKNQQILWHYKKEAIIDKVKYIFVPSFNISDGKFKRLWIYDISGKKYIVKKDKEYDEILDDIVNKFNDEMGGDVPEWKTEFLAAKKEHDAKSVKEILAAMASDDGGESDDDGDDEDVDKLIAKHEKRIQNIERELEENIKKRRVQRRLSQKGNAGANSEFKRLTELGKKLLIRKNIIENEIYNLENKKKIREQIKQRVKKAEKVARKLKLKQNLDKTSRRL